MNKHLYQHNTNNSPSKKLAGGLALIVFLIMMFAIQAVQATTSAVGSTPGSFSVSPSGAATYTIPIMIPPGTAGMAPVLSLNYNSQSGNGVLGVGWSLGGLSAIYRCAATIVQDGFKGGINYDANDRFCLDGQRLVAVKGSYGADGTEYRTETESYSRIVSYSTAGSGPAWFKVWTKAGQIVEYANTADSRIEAQGQATVRLWNVNKISDTKGNYLSVSYTEDNANGEATVNRIDYTGNAAAGVVPYASVGFIYEVKPDVESGYEVGNVIKSSKRIINIRTYSSATLSKDYRLAYKTSGAASRSLLSNLTECDGNLTCLPTVTFEWKTSTSGFNNAVWTVPNSWGGSGYTWVADFNGDGKADIASASGGNIYVHLSTGSGFSNATWTVPNNWGGSGYTWVADFNGDGKADIASASGGNIYVHLSTGSGFSNATWTVPNSWGTSSYTWVADFNGDGKADIAAAYYGSVYVHLSTGSGFSNATWTVPNSWGDSSYTWVADFNGDGKADIASAYYGSVYVHLSTGSGFSNATWAVPNSWGDSSYTWVADFNGDGKADIASAYYGSVYVRLSTGSGFSNATWTVPNSWGGSDYTRIADFSGDGIVDIASMSGSNIYVHFPTDSSLLLSTITNGLSVVTNITYKPLTDPTVYTKDNTATYPYLDLETPLYVVSQTQTSNGVGGNYETDYSYAGAKAHLTGGGFLGFRQVAVIDP